MVPERFVGFSDSQAAAGDNAALERACRLAAAEICLSLHLSPEIAKIAAIIRKHVPGAKSEP
jgi:hypothetical protein